MELRENGARSSKIIPGVELRKKTIECILQLKSVKRVRNPFQDFKISIKIKGLIKKAFFEMFQPFKVSQI
jgi:hypothetical protein